MGVKNPNRSTLPAHQRDRKHVVDMLRARWRILEFLPQEEQDWINDHRWLPFAETEMLLVKVLSGEINMQEDSDKPKYEDVAVVLYDSFDS